MPKENPRLITMQIGQNKLRDVIAILILAQLQEILVIHVDDHWIKVVQFLVVVAEPQPFLDKLCNYRVDAALHGILLDYIQF